MMFKKSLIFCITLCLLFALYACGRNKAQIDFTLEAPDECTPLLYRVTDENGNTLWLFGSIHVGQDSFYPLPEYVTTAYNAADALAVEFDVLTYQQDTSAMMQDLKAMVYQDGTTIADHIPQSLYEDCVRIMQENSSYVATLDYYNIAMWFQFIESFTREKAGTNTELGIDMHFLELAHQDGKPITDIESASLQYGLLASFSQELQIMLLESSVENYGRPDVYASSLQIMMNAWQSGNETLLSTLSNPVPLLATPEEQALYAEYTEAMITQRNINMADFAEDALVNGQELFICVGAAHVIGEGGMADLLAQRGYTVEVVQ